MIRRWFGLVLVLWATAASLISYAPATAPAALAANESYKFDAIKNIVGTGALNATFQAQGNTWVQTLNVGLPGQPCLIIYTIQNVSPGPPKRSTGNIFTVTQPADQTCTTNTKLNGNITIAAGPSPSSGTYTLSKDAQHIAASGFVDNNGNPVTFDYNASTNEYEWLPPYSQNAVDTITNLQPINNSTNYSATLTLQTSGTPTSTITIIATKNDAKPPDTSGPGNGNNNDKPTCDAGSLSWAICPFINFMIDVIDGIRDDILIPFLHVQPLQTTATVDGKAGQPNPVYQVWSVFRDAASVFFILVFFLIIFGTAVGFDNYTIKKILPHLIAGAILMPFTWYICTALIDVGNVIGQGIFALADQFIPAPKIDFTSPLSQLLLGGVGIAGTLGAISLAISSVAEIGIGILLTILFAVLAALFTLVLRQILIVLFIVISPFAVLAWILPNTQRIYKLWWQNFLRLVLMYPLIMLLFEAGRIFSLVAGTFITGGGFIMPVNLLINVAFSGQPLVGAPIVAAVPLALNLGAGQALAATNDFQKAAVPFLQLLGLFLPLAMVPWTFRWAGGAMAAGANALNRGRKALDNRYGRNSEGAKQKAENKRQQYALAADRLGQNSFRGRFARAASGNGAGFVGLSRGNALQQLKTQAAIDEAHKTQGQVSALDAARRGEVPHEGYQQRTAAEQQAAMNALTDERAARQGLTQATGSQRGTPPDLNTRYKAQAEMERRKQSTLAGEHESVVEGQLNHPGGPQASHAIASGALAAGLHDQAGVRGGTLGSNQHEKDMDELAIQAEERRRGTAITSPADRASVIARDRRLRFQTATHGATSKRVEEMGGHMADAAGRQKDEHDEETTAVAAAATAAVAAGRAFTADDRARVLSDVRRNRTGKIVGAGAETTRKAQAAATGEREATLNDAITNPLTREQLAQSAKDVKEGQLGIQAGTVRGNIQGTQAAIDHAKRLAQLQGRGRITDEEARQDVMRAGASAFQTLTSRQIQTAYGQNLSVADSERANPIRPDERIRAARYNQGRAYGKEAAQIRASSKTLKAQGQKTMAATSLADVKARIAADTGRAVGTISDAEARRQWRAIGTGQTALAMEGAARTSFEAGVETETENMGKAVGAEYAAITSGKAVPIGSADYIDDAQRQTERDLGAASGATQRRLQAARDAEAKLVAGGATPAAARRTLITNAAATGGRRAYIDTQKQYIADYNTQTGHQRAIENAMADAKAAGTPLTRAQAEEQVYASFASADEREAHNAAMGEYAVARGVVEARAGQAQATREELIKDGRTLKTIKSEIAARTGRSLASITDDEANLQLDNEVGELIEHAAHQKAVRDKRGEVVTSTGDEIGVKRGEDQMNRDEMENLRKEDKKAGKAPASDAELYARARQRDVSNKVGTAIRDKQEAVVTEMGGDEGGISGEDKAIRQEQDMHPDDYETLEDTKGLKGAAKKDAKTRNDARKMRNRDKARKQILTNVNREAERETRNARLGKASQAAGVKEGRRLRAAAVRTELAQRRGVKESKISNDDIEAAIEGSSYRNKVESKGEELRDSASENIGTRYGRENALRKAATEIQEKARKDGLVPPSDDVAYRQAEQENATAQLQTKLTTAEVAAGGKIGKNTGDANIDKAAIEMEQGTTLSHAHRFANDVTIGANTELATAATLAEDSEFPHDVTDTSGKVYKKGEIVPAGKRLRAGTEVTTGTKLAKGAILKAGTRVQRGSDAAKEAAAAKTASGESKLITRQEAKARVAAKGISSGQEQAERARAQEQGQTAAYDRAAHEGTPEPTERAETYEQAGLETIASDSANINAQSALAAEGRAMHRDMRSMVNSRTELSRRKIITDRVAERMNQRIPWAGNVALKDIDLSSSADTGNVVRMGREAARDLDSGQIDLAIAYTQRMTASDEGNTEVRRRSYRRRSQGGIGRTWNRSVDQSADPEKQYDLFWAESGAQAGHVDSGRPMIAGAHNPKSENFNGKGGYSNGDVQAMMDYYNLDDVGIRVEMAELQKDIDNPGLPEPQKAAARDQMKRLNETLRSDRWKGQGGRFVASLNDALEANNPTTKFDQQVIRTLANEAAYAAQHPDDKTLLFNQTEAAIKARNGIIARAAQSGITDWYRGAKSGSDKDRDDAGVTQPTVPLINYDDTTGDIAPEDVDLVRKFGKTDAERDALQARVIRPGMRYTVQEVYEAAGLTPEGKPREPEPAAA